VPVITIGLGGLLIILGLLGFFLTGATHPTALIPVVFGAIFEFLGVIAFKPNLRKHVMHAAATLGVIGFLGTVMAWPNMIRILSGHELAAGTMQAAVISKSIMAVLCAIFVALCVRSFIVARRQREAQNP